MIMTGMASKRGGSRGRHHGAVMKGRLKVYQDGKKVATVNFKSNIPRLSRRELCSLRETRVKDADTELVVS
jgi:hypothetical protein